MNLRPLFGLGAAALASSSLALDVYGISQNAGRDQNTLVLFNSDAPGTIRNSQAITGLSTGDRLVGLDFRASNGLLYAFGSQGNIYTLNKSTGAATFVSSLVNNPTNTGANVFNGLEGDENDFFAVDFNPVADRLRVISTTRQNLRINVDNGQTIADGRLNYAAGDPNVGQQINIVAGAYTNSFLGATAGSGTTTLYDIGATSDLYYRQAPPNNGTLNTVGGLGVNVTALSDYDIFSPSAGTNLGFLVTTTGSDSTFYSVDPLTGQATLIGTVGLGRVNLIAVDPVPEPASMVALGLGAAALLRRRRKA